MVNVLTVGSFTVLYAGNNSVLGTVQYAGNNLVHYSTVRRE